MDELPSALDINPFPESLDGKYAEAHFLGKTQAEAVKLFEDNFFGYQEDLLWMGPIGFRFYVRAAIEYAESDAARYDCEVASQLLSNLDHKWHYEHDQIPELRGLFLGYAERLRARLGDMDIESYFDYRLERKVLRFIAKLEST
ncbi:hypothetical protein GC176_25080 [bacterium]|nr:hypothetical protein [bacterium]